MQDTFGTKVLQTEFLLQAGAKLYSNVLQQGMRPAFDVVYVSWMHRGLQRQAQ
jgi:hypothetical protein